VGPSRIPAEHWVASLFDYTSEYMKLEVLREVFGADTP